MKISSSRFERLASSFDCGLPLNHRDDERIGRRIRLEAFIESLSEPTDNHIVEHFPQYENTKKGQTSRS